MRRFQWSGQGRSVQRTDLSGGTAGFGQPGAIRLHRLLALQRSQRLPQNLRGPAVGRHDDAVVHPLAFAPCRNHARVSQIREMTRDLRLRRIQNLDEVADADFLVAHQVQQTQPGPVSQRLEESLQIEVGFFCHDYIFALTDVLVKNIVALADMFREGFMQEPLLDSVKAKYGAVAASTLSSEHAGVRAVAEAFGYTAEELTSIPAEANMGLSCGNPTATAHLRSGEVVVDLGSGGGLDVFLAAKKVGPAGRVIGIDMTPEMIERARANARAGGYTNVEFHHATIDHLPVADASVDCIISNCVLNLAPDKPAVFREIFRVLRPGGRLAVSDIALKAELPQEIASSFAAYVGCIAGAIRIDDYRAELLKAGFQHVEIVDSGADLNAYTKVENQSGCCSPAMDPSSRSTSPLPIAQSACCAPSEPTVHEDLRALLAAYDVNAAAASVKVYALKPAAQSCCGPTCCA